MHSIPRRTFLSSGLFGGIGLLTAGRRSTLRHPIEEWTPPAAAGHVRHNVYCLTASSPEIRAYKKAITVMRARPTTDPTSWQAQSNIHGAFRPNAGAGIINKCPPAGPADFVAPPGMIADACQHATFFLAWHRMYLYYFERIVRTASGDPTFALPYWGYSPAGRRDLPDVFRTPNNATNPLWTDQRAPWANTGGNMNPSAVDSTLAFATTPYSLFNDTVRSSPHNTVHGAVGDGCGWMSAFETAGMDPIFWLHHCNIDRLWEDWIASGGGRVNPTTDPAWMNQSYNFYDEAGATVTLRVSQILDTVTQLDHRYAPPTVCPGRFICFCIPRRPWLEDDRITSLADSIYRRPPLSQAVKAAEQAGPITLAAKPVQVRLPFDATLKRQFAVIGSDAKAGRRIKLVVDDVRLLQNPMIYYEIYVDLPADVREAVYTSPLYIGNLDFFTSARPDHNRISRDFDLVMPFVNLSSMKRWLPDRLEVTFVPKSFAEADDPARALRGRPQATIGRVLVTIE
jgi:tyrosinase